MVRAGVPQPVAMEITGHKTASMFRRYAIVNETDISEGLARLAKLDEGTNARIERRDAGSVDTNSRSVHGQNAEMGGSADEARKA
jgi:hypothetical protein